VATGKEEDQIKNKMALKPFLKVFSNREYI